MHDVLTHSLVLKGLATVWLALMLGWICLVDIRHFRIPDAASLGLVVSGIALSIVSPVVTPALAVIGASVGYGTFAALGAAFYHHTGKDGLGLGDAKLLGAAGAWLGLYDLPVLVSVSALSALVFALITGLRKIAFGPWLAGAFWIIWMVRVSA